MALVAEKLSSILKQTAYDVDPDESTATAAAWVPMQDYGSIICTFVRTIGTGALDVFKIQAATDSSGTGAADVVSHAVASEPNLIADIISLEATSDMILEALADATHVSMVIEFATSTDECIAFYTRGLPTFPQAGLNADVIA